VTNWTEALGALSGRGRPTARVISRWITLAAAEHTRPRTTARRPRALIACRGLTISSPIRVPLPNPYRNPDRCVATVKPVRAIEASARLKRLLSERDVQVGKGVHAAETARLAWELFCAAALEPADTPFDHHGAITRVGDHDDADLLLFEAGAYSPRGQPARYGLAFTRQFSLECEDDDAGMNSVTLSIDFDGDELTTWPTDQLWGYAGRHRDDVSDEHHPEIDNWAGHVPSWGSRLEARPAFKAFAELQPVRILVEQSDI
jgi:hypothetical protein